MNTLKDLNSKYKELKKGEVINESLIIVGYEKEDDKLKAIRKGFTYRRPHKKVIRKPDLLHNNSKRRRLARKVI